MASGDGNQETGRPPDFHGTPFRWGSLLSAVRDQIPSMDSDVSLVIPLLFGFTCLYSCTYQIFPLPISLKWLWSGWRNLFIQEVKFCRMISEAFFKIVFPIPRQKRGELDIFKKRLDSLLSEIVQVLLLEQRAGLENLKGSFQNPIFLREQTGGRPNIRWNLQFWSTWREFYLYHEGLCIQYQLWEATKKKLKPGERCLWDALQEDWICRSGWGKTIPETLMVLRGREKGRVGGESNSSQSFGRSF